MRRKPLAILLSVITLLALTMWLTWGRHALVPGRSQAWLWAALLAAAAIAEPRQVVRAGPPSVARVLRMLIVVCVAELIRVLGPL